MTTQPVEQETITALLFRSPYQEVRGKQTVTVYEFKARPDAEYATKITWWPSQEDKDAEAPALRLNQWYRVTCSKKPVPMRADGKGGRGFYRNLLSAVPATGPDTTAAPPQAQLPGGTAAFPASAPFDAHETRMDRRTAIMQAPEYAKLVFSDQELPTIENILDVAEAINARLLVWEHSPGAAARPAEAGADEDAPDDPPFGEPPPAPAVASPLGIAGHVRSVVSDPWGKRPPMPNAGAFLNYAFTTHRLTRAKALDAVDVTDIGQIDNWEEAADALDKAMAQRGKK